MTYIPDELRRQVIERAKNCCEYCLMPQALKVFPFEVDHIIPEKHLGKTILANLSYACMKCNRHKGSDFASIDPETEDITRLFNPRKDLWDEHFHLNGAIIEPITLVGKATIFLLQLNTVTRILERQELIDIGRYPCK